MNWITIALAGCIPLSLILGLWWGKRRTIRLFNTLRESGELVVMTPQQAQDRNKMRSALYENRDIRKDEIEQVSYDRRDAEWRRDDWAKFLRARER